MKLTAERKRLVYLVGVLAVLGGYSLYTNVLSSPAGSAPHRPTPVTARPANAARPQSASSQTPSALESGPSVSRQSASARSSAEFRPSLKPKRAEDRVDPMTIDPTLRLDLLAKVQAVNMEGGQRNLFAVGTAPPVALPPEPKVAVKGAVKVAMGPQPAPTPPAPPPPPPPPPINLKYYGYSSAAADNKKHAFFLDGDDILVAAEGETMKKRYRVVKIGVNSVTVEDTQYKHEQTLPLQEEAAG